MPETGQEISLGELVDDAFIRRRTGFASLHALAQAGGLDPTDITGFEALDTDEFTQFLGEHTPFASFDELLKTALRERNAR